jgi:hypothetical protein
LIPSSEFMLLPPGLFMMIVALLPFPSGEVKRRRLNCRV